MKLEIVREQLLKPLQAIIGVIERKQTLPVLSNVWIQATPNEVTLTATDMELELSCTFPHAVLEPGTTTLPARKLFDILRALPEACVINLTIEENRCLLKSGRSRFNLLTLPAEDFPTLDNLQFDGEVTVPQHQFRTLLDNTHFAMAVQDVRYYLNGLLIDIKDQTICAVATDGHRLAYSEMNFDQQIDMKRQIIIPRKGIQELLRLLDMEEVPINLRLSATHLQLENNSICFTSKLIDGKFPDYNRVIPEEGQKIVVADRATLSTSMTRAAILASDKFRGIRLQGCNWLLKLDVHNPEQEQAEEEIEVNYSGEDFEIAFNVNYMLDAINALDSEMIKLSFNDSNSSCLISSSEHNRTKYVVMPMRI